MMQSMSRLVIVFVLMVSIVLAIAPTTSAASFADPAIKAVWDRTDGAVAAGTATTSWLWGPQPNTPGVFEGYQQSPQSRRLVQYFDKARMEINNPAASTSELWYVTNGLLPIELITGKVQTGDTQFEDRTPATIAAIGDSDNTFPTYADLATIVVREGAGHRVGTPVTSLFTPDRTVGSYDVYRTDPATVVALVENKHGIPAAFLTFMDQQSGSLGRLFVFGAPVSGAYWVKARVGSVERSVMFQVYERRLLTYTPDNQPRFRVESGNVGQHYYRWRYAAPTLHYLWPTNLPSHVQIRADRSLMNDTGYNLLLAYREDPESTISISAGGFAGPPACSRPGVGTSIVVRGQPGIACPLERGSSIRWQEQGANYTLTFQSLTTLTLATNDLVSLANALEVVDRGTWEQRLAQAR